MFSVCSMFYSMYWMKIIHKICQNQIYRNIYYENNQKLLSKNSQPLLNFLFPWFRNRFGWSCRTKKNYWNVYIYAYLRASNDFTIKMSLNYSASYDNLSTILIDIAFEIRWKKVYFPFSWYFYSMLWNQRYCNGDCCLCGITKRFAVDERHALEIVLLGYVDIER